MWRKVGLIGEYRKKEDSRWVVIQKLSLFVGILRQGRLRRRSINSALTALDKIATKDQRNLFLHFNISLYYNFLASYKFKSHIWIFLSSFPE